jgi:hypothetical protein
MKKIVALLFLSFFVSTINAATMPVDLNKASTSVVASGHDHCQEGASVSHHESSKSSASTNATHSCCAVVAILITSPAFSQFTQVDVYLLSDIAIPASNIAESIYKPPRNYL